MEGHRRSVEGSHGRPSKVDEAVGESAHLGTHLVMALGRRLRRAAAEARACAFAQHDPGRALACRGREAPELGGAHWHKVRWRRPACMQSEAIRSNRARSPREATCRENERCPPSETARGARRQKQETGRGVTRAGARSRWSWGRGGGQLVGGARDGAREGCLDGTQR